MNWTRLAAAVGIGLLSGCTLKTSLELPVEPQIGTAESDVSAEALVQPTSEVQATELTYSTHTLTHSLVHVVTVPPDGGFQVGVAMTDALMTLRDMAERDGAIAAINAGFFDPQNGLTTSYITLAGTIVADPHDNRRLIDNPDLQPYLSSILNRSEFRIYTCGDATRYDIAFHDASVPSDCVLADAIGAGPQLLPSMTGYEEGFLDRNDSGEVVRDVLGSRTPNARSAIGIKPDGSVVLAIAAQFPTADAPSGLNLQGMADFLASLGVEKALNLDGGSSTGLYFDGTTYLGRLDAEGNEIERPIKSILFVSRP
ncbi:phosphodiester glycosidase family protein [Oscillatoria sp. CS-180]|uniref:phosphodiester glycosidase family protein n=1 Tax=Oscillatoria sp. CS-180 TaxID=3021720 RepID=UPI00232EC104|nr:phosphodiester glycosidase family protein [Oscillatoria sp. CS-180]MDB9525384.1 phosphodiester glycosidase family protein [Oscillatoria sp. CS-180]